MPGYGFAKANRAVKEDWQDTMFGFLRGRVGLRRVVLLLDSRVELKRTDEDVMALLDRAAVVFQLVLTKCDAPKPQTLAAKREEALRLCARYAAAYPEPLLTSSETGAGIPELRAALAALAEPAPSATGVPIR